jgi:hypothetical protein
LVTSPGQIRHAIADPAHEGECETVAKLRRKNGNLCRLGDQTHSTVADRVGSPCQPVGEQSHRRSVVNSNGVKLRVQGQGLSTMPTKV